MKYKLIMRIISKSFEVSARKVTQKYKLPVAKRELQNRVRKWHIQGRGPGVQGSALFLGQTEVRRAEKNFVLKPSPHPRPPPYLRVCMTAP